MWRLIWMMFIGFLPPSMWAVTVGTYIGANTGASGSGIFREGFVGIAYGSAAIGSAFAPIVIGALADRLFSAERILFLLHLMSAFFLWQMSIADSQWLFFALMIAYFHCYMPVAPLSTSVALQHLPRPEQQFSQVRVMGTAAWVVGGWFIGFACPLIWDGSIESTPIPMRIASVSHLVAAASAFLIPHTPPAHKSDSLSLGSLLGLDAIRLLKVGKFAILTLAMFLIAIPFQFYISYSNLFLNVEGVSGAAGKLAFGQFTEMICILLLPIAFRVLGVKKTILLGCVGWIVRFGLLATADGASHIGRLYAAILLHGVSHAFVALAAQVYVDRIARGTARSAAQGLLSLTMSGIGQLAGAMLASLAQIAYLTPPNVEPIYDWQTFWGLALLLAIPPTLLIAFGFRDVDHEAEGRPGYNNDS